MSYRVDGAIFLFAGIVILIDQFIIRPRKRKDRSEKLSELVRRSDRALRIAGIAAIVGGLVLLIRG